MQIALKETTIAGVSCKSGNLTISNDASTQSHPFLSETSEAVSPATMQTMRPVV